MQQSRALDPGVLCEVPCGSLHNSDPKPQPLRRYGRNKAGHSNRVFSVKFSQDDDNVVLSAGWDNTVQIWDIRMDSPVRPQHPCDHVAAGKEEDLFVDSLSS